MKDHEIAALVNTLRDIAIKYHGSQQLREQIAAVVVPALQRAALPSLRTSQVTALKAYRDEMRDACSYFQDTSDVEERLTAILESVSPHPPRTLPDDECEAIGSVTAALQQSSSRITAGAETPSQVVDSGAAGRNRTDDLLITNQGAETAETLGNQQDTPTSAPAEGAKVAQGESSTCEGVTAGLRPPDAAIGSLLRDIALAALAELEADAEIGRDWRADSSLIEEIGADGPESAEDAAKRAVTVIQRQRARIAALEAEKAERERQEPVAWAWDDALGCMHAHCGSKRPVWVDGECSDAKRAETSLRPLYAAPPIPRVEQEPVAWVLFDDIFIAPKDMQDDPPNLECMKPLYAHPLALREPTEDECAVIYETFAAGWHETLADKGRAMFNAVREVMTK